MIKNRKRNIVKYFCVALMSMLCGITLLSATGSALEVNAAGNSPISTIAGYETHNHVVQQSMFGTSSNYSESKYKNTGIKIFASNNSGSTTTGTSIELDSSSFYVDFTGANSMYVPSGVYEDICYTLHYRFEIISSSGYTSWYIDYTADIENEPYERVFNVNGNKTTKYDAEGTDCINFQPTELGNRLVSLYSGNFTWKLTREYMWIKMDLDNSIYAIYDTTSTMTGTLLIDTTKPTLTAKGYTNNSTITSGSYVNQRVTFTASDTNFERIYYKLPTNTYYNSTTAKTYTSSATNGWWTVYAVDTVGNKTNEFTFYYDATSPTGSISSNGTTVASGSYVSKSFAYTASDSGSGIKQIYYKSPVSSGYQTYSAGTIIPATAGDGWYYFYSVDNAGNQSATMSVYLETEAPLIEIYRNGKVAYSTSMTTGGTFDTGVYFNRFDYMKITYDSSSGNVSCNYTLDSNFQLASNFTGFKYTIVLTTPTGITGHYTFYVVDTNPYISIGDMNYYNGQTVHLNKDTYVSFFDDSDITDSADTGVTITSEGHHIIDTKATYKELSGMTLSTPEGTETTYHLTLNDRAGNISKINIVIDKDGVDAVWTNDEEEIPNNGYTNKPVYLYYEESSVTATYSKDGGEYKTYTKGTEFSEDGAYSVILQDLAGNKTTYVINVDTVSPTGSLYADYQEVENNSVTNGKIYFTWDGENTATVNGAPYTRNTVISEDGLYEFVLQDKAGNTSTYKIRIDTLAPELNQELVNSSEDYLVGKWFLVNVDDTQTSFADYESALEFASTKEFEKYVTALELDDVNNFTQYHLVASKGNPEDDVRVGTYWRYKSQANPESELYYFDESLLKEVVSHYAKAYVSEINYYTLGENNYGEVSNNMFDNTWTSDDGINAPLGNNFSFTEFDSCEVYMELVGGSEGKVAVEFNVPLKEQFNVTGLYEVTEIDEAGNTSNYYIFLDFSAPNLVVNAEVFGDGEVKEMTITSDTVSTISTYYYKSFEVSQIVDNDSWATIAITNDGKTTYYSKGDELPVLTGGGKYDLVVYDRLNNSYEFVVYIVGNEATIEFSPNSESTEFTIDISLEQEFDTIVSLEIYKDGEKLEGVTPDTLTYTFTKDGTYIVVLRDNFGRVIERTYEFDKSLPNGSLSIDNGSRTTEEVTFTFDNSKYVAEVSKDGELIETNSSGEILVSDDGNYSIKLINLTDEENFNTYQFTIDTKAPGVNLDGVEQGKTTNTDVSVSWSDEDVVSATYTKDNGESVVLENGATLTEEGIYVVKVVDDLGNTTEVMFTIDKSLDYEVYVDNTSATGVETTGEDVLVINNEELHISVTKNGEAYEYSFGDVLSEEGTYLIKISDDHGNTTVIQITIDKSVNAHATTGNGTISNEEVIIVAGEKVSVIVTKDGQAYDYTLGQSITEEGKYNVTIYDAYGNQKTITFEIVNGTKSVLDYTLGESVEVIEVKHNGEVIEWDSNHLNFTEDGIYEVTVLVDGEEYSFELSLDTTAPEITLNGIEDGEAGNVTVTITDMTEEGTVKVYKDGVEIEYNLGDELKDYGEYVVEVTDELGNTRSYSFTLEYQMNGWAIALIIIGLLAIAGIVVLICLKKKRVFKD